MPGASCAVVGCGTCNGKHKGLSFFSIRQPKHPEWEEALVRGVNRCDANFRREKAKICSRHFTPECIRTSGVSGRCSLVPGSLPTLWMPQKSVETPKPAPRKPPAEREPPKLPDRVAYYSFDEVRKASANLPVPWVHISNTDTEIVVGIVEGSVLKFKVHVMSDFSTTVFVLGFPAKGPAVNIESSSLSSFLTKLSSMHVCPGVCEQALQEFAHLPSGDPQQLYFRHVVCMSACDSAIHTSTVRSSRCTFLITSASVCQTCTYVQTLLRRKQERAIASLNNPIKINNPLLLPKEKLKSELKSTRRHSRAVEKKLAQFIKKLNDKKESVEVSSNAMHKSLKSVVETHINQQSFKNPLTKLFWEEQLKAFQCKNSQGMRWHPMMIRLAILIHSRSAAAYTTLVRTGVLRLPGLSTLQDYTNIFHPQAGFNKNTLESIKEASKKFTENERFVSLLHDEMTIKQDLVFDRRSGQMVGFISGRDGGEPLLASHVLVFYVVGINTNLSTSLGYFGTQTATADTLFPLFWKAIGLLEKVCNLHVIASTSDKATPNQRLCDMHGTGNAICYKTTNIFAREREVFFISDPPHLIKTLRNNLYNSGAGKSTRYLWINGQHMLWQHVVDLYNKDCTQQLRMTKLTHQHVHLTPASLMNVKLAAQVLSERVGKLMKVQGVPECQQTAEFILKIDKFFDCLNTRALTEGQRKKKDFLKPYCSPNDERFYFLDELLQYFEQWKNSVQQRPGFCQAEKNKMFISRQTYKGMVMTLKAFPEAAKYLLNHGVQFVLSNRFCQDPLEKHFGRHRGLGRRNDNPSFWMFGYNENKLRLQRNLALAIEPRGNISKRRRTQSDSEDTGTVTNSPMKKRKR